MDSGSVIAVEGSVKSGRPQGTPLQCENFNLHVIPNDAYQFSQSRAFRHFDRLNAGMLNDHAG